MKVQITADEIVSFIRRNSDLFEPPYHQRVDLREYALKLEKYATHFVSKVDHVITGFLACYLNDNQRKIGYISYLCVDKEFQKSGLGQSLMEEAIKFTCSIGFIAITLEVDKINLGALKFYSSFGFVKSNEKHSTFLLTKQLVND